MKTVVYVLYNKEVENDLDVFKCEPRHLCDMFHTKYKAHKALKEWHSFGEAKFSVIEGAIETRTLMDMASCSMRGSNYGSVDIDVINVWNYG